MPPRSSLQFSTADSEKRKMVIFSEFLLRHHFEHILFPEKSEAEVVGSDIDFAKWLSGGDPRAYNVPRSALDDSMNGIRGKDYAHLLDGAEQGSACEFRAARIVSTYPWNVAELPGRFLTNVFQGLGPEEKMEGPEPLLQG